VTYLSLLLQRPGLFWRPPPLVFNGCRGVFLRGRKRSGHEVDQSRAEVMNEWSYISAATIVYGFMAWAGTV
jgi:hypothetical protein